MDPVCPRASRHRVCATDLILGGNPWESRVFRCRVAPANIRCSFRCGPLGNGPMSAHLETAGAGERSPTAHELARRALFAFLLTFILARTVVFLIMARRIPNLYFFLHDTHVHHLNYGIFLLAAVGAYLLFAQPSGEAARRAAFAYGIAMALTFDEFGMWLHLGGSYWQRASIDATVVVAAVLALVAYARSIRTFEARHVRAFIALAIALVLFGVVLCEAAIRIGNVEGPRLRELELASSP
jgi:hypothetical protein